MKSLELRELRRQVYRAFKRLAEKGIQTVKTGEFETSLMHALEGSYTFSEIHKFLSDGEDFFDDVGIVFDEENDEYFIEDSTFEFFNSKKLPLTKPTRVKMEMDRFYSNLSKTLTK